jgi:hypothetical protein
VIFFEAVDASGRDRIVVRVAFSTVRRSAPVDCFADRLPTAGLEDFATVLSGDAIAAFPEGLAVLPDAGALRTVLVELRPPVVLTVAERLEPAAFLPALRATVFAAVFPAPFLVVAERPVCVPVARLVAAFFAALATARLLAAGFFVAAALPAAAVRFTAILRPGLAALRGDDGDEAVFLLRLTEAAIWIPRCRGNCRDSEGRRIAGDSCEGIVSAYRAITFRSSVHTGQAQISPRHPGS